MIKIFTLLLLATFFSACANTPKKTEIITSEINCDDISIQGEVSVPNFKTELARITQSITKLEDIQKREEHALHAAKESVWACEPAWAGEHCRGVEGKKLNAVNKKIDRNNQQLEQLNRNKRVYECLIERYQAV